MKTRMRDYGAGREALCACGGTRVKPLVRRRQPQAGFERVGVTQLSVGLRCAPQGVGVGTITNRTIAEEEIRL